MTDDMEAFLGCYLFNNRNRDHKVLFGDDAVFDIDLPSQINDWNRLTFNAPGRNIRWFDKTRKALVVELYELTGWRPAINPATGGEVRVVLGTYQGTETIPYGQALLQHPRIFTKIGTLKQVSVLEKTPQTRRSKKLGSAL